jgi:hypothetical protein
MPPPAPVHPEGSNPVATKEEQASDDDELGDGDAVVIDAVLGMASGSSPSHNEPQT